MRHATLGPFVVTALLAFHACSATATTYVVQPDGLGDYANIQDAVNACSEGDTVALTDGLFSGLGNIDVVVPSMPITIRSQSGDPLQCGIDCGGGARQEHRAFHFTDDVGTGDAVLMGISMVNGYTTTHGAGIWIEGADPEIMQCIVAQCTADGTMLRGGGMYLSDGADPWIVQCLVAECTGGYGGGVAIFNAAGIFDEVSVTDNNATNRAGGLYQQGNDGTSFWGCEIVSNDAPSAAGMRIHGSSTLFQYCNISRNEASAGNAGGVLMQGGTLSNCTLVENSATGAGGGVYCDFGTGDLEYCIVAYTEDGSGVCATAGNEPSLSCCDVFGNVEGNYDAVVGDQTGLNDNFSVDPEFCDLEGGNYGLDANSPCTDTASPCGNWVGAYEIECDTPVRDISWGSLKARWR